MFFGNVADAFLDEHRSFWDAGPAASLSDAYCNGMDAMIMQSDEDKIKFKNYIEKVVRCDGARPRQALMNIISENEFAWDNMLQYDKNEVINYMSELEDIYGI